MISSWAEDRPVLKNLRSEPVFNGGFTNVVEAPVEKVFFNLSVRNPNHSGSCIFWSPWMRLPIVNR